MKHLALIPLAYLALVLQAGLSPRLAIGPAVPLFLPLLALWTPLRVEGRTAIVWAAAIGLLADCLSAHGLGVEMLCAVVAALVVQRWKRGRSQRPGLSLALLQFGAVFVWLAAATMLRAVLGNHAVDVGRLAPFLAGTAAYTVLIGVTAALCCRIAGRLITVHGSRARFAATEGSAPFGRG